jgi:hypothetical protein
MHNRTKAFPISERLVRLSDQIVFSVSGALGILVRLKPGMRFNQM